MKKTINIEKSIHQEIKIFCAKKNIKISDWLEEIIKRALNDNQ